MTVVVLIILILNGAIMKIPKWIHIGVSKVNKIAISVAVLGAMLKIMIIKINKAILPKNIVMIINKIKDNILLNKIRTK